MRIQELQAKEPQFLDKDDWAHNHDLKDFAISLSLETAEVLEIFQWRDCKEVETLESNKKVSKREKEELEDIFIYALTLAQSFGFDPAGVIPDKVGVN